MQVFAGAEENVVERGSELAADNGPESRDELIRTAAHYGDKRRAMVQPADCGL